MAIQIIQNVITGEQLKEIGNEHYDELIKGVVDIERRLIAVGGDMHSDTEEILLKDGSKQSDLWGFNILFDTAKEDCLAYESFINIRPREHNNTLDVQNSEIREKMKQIIFEWIQL